MGWIKKQRLLASLLCTASLSVSFSANLYASEIVRVFGNEEKPPKIWKEKRDNRGILVDILKLLEPELNVTFDVQTYPWKRALHHAKAERGAIIGFSKTPQRLTEFDYSQPIYYDKVTLVVKKGSEFRFEQHQDLTGKVIGVCAGCSFGEEFENAKRYFIADDNGNNIGRLKMVLSGRLDAAILGSGESELEKLCASTPGLNREDFTILKKPLVLDPNYLAFKKTMYKGEFLTRFNRALTRKMRSGEIESIVQSYVH